MLDLRIPPLFTELLGRPGCRFAPSFGSDVAQSFGLLLKSLQLLSIGVLHLLDGVTAFLLRGDLNRKEVSVGSFLLLWDQ